MNTTENIAFVVAFIVLLVWLYIFLFCLFRKIDGKKPALPFIAQWLDHKKTTGVPMSFDSFLKIYNVMPYRIAFVENCSIKYISSPKGGHSEYGYINMKTPLDFYRLKHFLNNEESIKNSVRILKSKLETLEHIQNDIKNLSE